MLMYGANTYFWRRYRVNYPFIFGYKPGTELGFREIFLLASGLLVLAFAAVLANLDMEMDPNTESFQTITELVPLFLVICCAVVLVITFCPFNIIYRSSRFFLIRCVWRCILAPLYMVTFSDSFLADQLTSQVQALRILQFYVCYYGWGDFRRRSNTCPESDHYENFYIAIAIIPYLARVLQCLRRVFEEKNVTQG
ncbi:Phosphate transporter PHO1 8 [Castilleja foliolosa]|uniref:Phosphate transporter PHO1 8 n=1 Tax=Castilleja foliolosa TaxID=1961234 RepID=A0ABD3D4W8_9LAMI